MLRKSLQILVGAVLLTLAAIVAFASLHLSGPEQTLAEATKLIGRREFARAIALLDLTERDVQRDPPRAARLWRLRYGANTELGNARAALRDVEQLLATKPADDQALRLDQIRLLAVAGDGSAARLAAQRFLADHPGHGRALELAGEACQTLYQPELRAVLERLERELPAADRRTARSHAFAYLFRPAGDPEIATAQARLAELHAHDPRLQTAWQPASRDLLALRERVQEALQYFRDSLAAPGTPVAAFRAFALSLDQSRRIDDLLAACEIQRRRFAHRYVGEAGAAAAWALLREEQYAAVLATAERWLPAGSVAQQLNDKALDAGTLDLLVARAWAAHRLGDRPALERSWQDGQLLWKAPPPAPLAAPVGSGLFDFARRDWVSAEVSMRSASEMLARAAVPVDRFDLLPEIAGLWLATVQNRGGTEADVMAVLRAWRLARPATVAPLLAQAAVLAGLGRPAAAAAALDEARIMAPDDDRIFDRYLAAVREVAKENQQDGESLLAQCLIRQVAVPEVRHPVGYLLCGEVALAREQLTIARLCARRAIDAYPRARAPRLLEIRVSLATSRFDEAAQQATQLVELTVPDAETIDLALAALRGAGRDGGECLAAMLAAGSTSTPLQLALLRAALARDPATAHTFVVPAVTAADAPAALRLLGARALAHAADPTAAALVIDGVLAQPDDRTAERRHELPLAFAAWLQAAAAVTADAELAPVAHRRLTALGEIDAAAARTLLASVRSLARSHPATAFQLLLPALAATDPEDRNGADYALAGQLALQAGRWRMAEESWTAALAFRDGAGCAEALARLLLAQGRPDRALQVWNLVDAPQDPGLATRFQRVELAAQLVGEEILRDPADLLAHCALALAGETVLADWPAAAGPELQNRAELLCLLHEPALAPFARERLEALRAAEPRSRTTRLLLARALADAGCGEAAAALHEELAKQGAFDPVFYREVARAADAPGYRMSPTVRTNLMAAATNREIGGSQLTLAFALRLLETGFRDGGRPDLAEQTRLSAWQQAPVARAMTADDLQLVAGKLPAPAAWFVIDRALGGPFPIDRPAAIDRLHELARRVAEVAPEQVAHLVATARRYLASDGARGSIVHFLLDVGSRNAPPEQAAAERAELCHRHLELVAAGRDGDRELGATLRCLQAEQGLDATVAEVEALLRRHPTALPLWLARARLGADTSRAATAIAELRAVLRHADAPALQLEMLTLAAEGRTSQAADGELLAALPQPLRDSPAGKYAAAMLALRSGHPDVAAPDLAQAPPRGDGMHLFAYALAALQSGDEDGPVRARAAFEQLQRDYPSSSLARNAGSFASQLALP